jgi:hypothetical protein
MTVGDWPLTGEAYIGHDHFLRMGAALRHVSGLECHPSIKHRMVVMDAGNYSYGHLPIITAARRVTHAL